MPPCLIRVCVWALASQQPRPRVKRLQGRMVVVTTARAATTVMVRVVTTVAVMTMVIQRQRPRPGVLALVRALGVDTHTNKPCTLSATLIRTTHHAGANLAWQRLSPPTCHTTKPNEYNAGSQQKQSGRQQEFTRRRCLRLAVPSRSTGQTRQAATASTSHTWPLLGCALRRPLRPR